MTTPTDPHEEFEIAALRRARGALDADGVAKLDAHLATCDACRGFAETDAAARTALRRRAQEAAAAKDWEKVRRGGRRRRLDDLGFGLRMLVWIPAFAAVVWLTGGTPVDVVAFATFVALIALCVTAIRAFRRRRKMMTAQQHGAAAFFGQYRRALDVEIERLRTVQTSLLLSLAIFVGYDVAQLVEREDLNHGSGLWEKLVLDLFLWWLVCGEILYRSRYVLPRLERERRDLGK